MNHTKLSLLATYGNIIRKYKKKYAFPTQNTVLALLWRHHSVIIKKRTLCYHIADLRKQGYINVIQRTRNDANGQIRHVSSAVYLTMKGTRLLWKLGCSWALSHLKRLRDKFYTFPDNPPSPPTIDPDDNQHPGWLPKGLSFDEILANPAFLKRYPKMKRLKTI